VEGRVLLNVNITNLNSIIMWKTIKRSLFDHIGIELRSRNETYEWQHAYPSGWDKTTVNVKLTEKQWAYFGL
jgi:hypothetical protein